ncbi:unnamed protein product [Sphagnum jensenii]|uniref:Secreted protein n=1 Tax=Sphagnum jensenii TaxID=128206 RepID=A0ABP1BPG6_9BRYO
MWFRCRFLLVCIVALLSACLMSRRCPCFETKNGLTSLNQPQLQQHHIEKGSDEPQISSQVQQHHIEKGSDEPQISSQGLAPHYRLRGSWAQLTATTAATATTTTSLKGNWISTHNIAAVIQDSAGTRSAQDSAAIRSADEGEESRYLLEFERDYVEPGPNVNNNLDAPSPQPFPSN